MLLLGWLGPVAVHRLAGTGVDARTANRPFAPAAVPGRPRRPVARVGAGHGRRTWRPDWCWCATGPASRTLDAATGRPAWRYLREGRSLVGLGAAAGGRVVVGLWRGDGETRAIGFDASSGSRRWERGLDGSTVDHQVVGSGGLAVLVPRGGRRRWWRSTRPTGRQPLGMAARERRVRHHGGGRRARTRPATPRSPWRSRVPTAAASSGLSTTDGAVRWTWAPATGSDPPAPPPRGTAPGGARARRLRAAPGSHGRRGARQRRHDRAGAGDGERAGRRRPPGRRAGWRPGIGTTALYLGSAGAAAVDLALGRERWRTPLPAATTPVDVTGLSGAGFGLVAPDRGGPARVLRYDVSTGAVAAERQVDDAAVRLWIGPSVLVLATTAGELYALG